MRAQGVNKLGDKRSESKCALVFGQMNEPPGARARVALTGLTIAEHFRDHEGQDVLLFVDNIFRFTQARPKPHLEPRPFCVRAGCIGAPVWLLFGRPPTRSILALLSSMHAGGIKSPALPVQRLGSTGELESQQQPERGMPANDAGESPLLH